MSLFSAVQLAPRDPILGLNEAFNADARPTKVNLGVGVYTNEDGKIPLLRAVREAEKARVEAGLPRGYLPIDGIAAYDAAVQKLLLGNDSPLIAAGRVVTAQALGGTGALKIGADFLRTVNPNVKVAISDPSWENHRALFEAAGFEVVAYPYYDAATNGVNFEGMLSALNGYAAGTVVVLHACCHNPTGVDLDEGQWEKLIDVIEARGLLPFVDMAYQGFGAGLDADAFAVRELARRGVPTLVANSFSKNFSLYGERVGGLSVVCEDAAAAERVLGQLAGAVRSNYSNPQTYGAKVVAAVLGTPALRKQWEEELSAMCRRIARMRQSIHDGLRDHVSGEALTRYVKQRGMFTYTGLTESQVDALREVHGVYILRSGRMCVAGLNDSNVGIVADAIGKVLKSGA